jgi:hypothetical protein
MRKSPTPKPKKVQFSLIDPKRTPQHEAYPMMAELRSRHHHSISEARIALAWRKGLKRDKDGHLMLGKCVKASDLQRELVEWDFVILLNKEVWEDIQFGKEKKLALLDHELCHAEVSTDKEGDPVRDEKGRKVWRVRRHDIEEFNAVVIRHGTYKADLERFAEALLKRAKTPLFNTEETTVTLSVKESNGEVKESAPVPLGKFNKLAKAVRKAAEAPASH